ncbi:FadR/GntR family transcriptional regulator [Bordetella pseudohinzii]|uniref:L-lactate utilization operon repressor n=2 Tax=Bordetella pseudohinzii TaxID=1331258 RepID=A0A0J6CDH2_9BORD|nr:FadR/GntR family transcriptional regulator [Bordetella pseudohinzii]ANY16528.1 hypothetical protein BBN53_11855 [Bordetella pseudohinzii]KMM27677.1 hypothetical protein L540_01370 [Bordetella pseudohinzii]CUI33861.1 L-lactate utilization operon repressor [Bordetella pseudohinzii]
MQRVDDLEFAPVLKRSAAQDVRARLITLIETGKLAVDSKLPSENDLARSFGVSRPVIREALVGLQALGLTKTLNGRGCYVASRTVATPMLMGQYTPEQLNEVRRCLEVPSARAAAERRSQADLGTLAEIINAMETEEEAYKRNQLDVAFHVAIAHATGNPLFVKLIEELRTVLEEHSRAAATVPGRRSAAVQEHRAVYEAILQRDGEAAARAMAAHVNAADNSFSLLPSGAAPSR